MRLAQNNSPFNPIKVPRFTVVLLKHGKIVIKIILLCCGEIHLSTPQSISVLGNQTTAFKMESQSKYD